MAECAADLQARAVLIQMAQVWFRLAQDHTERSVSKHKQSEEG
jgi:hypothetical protein